MKWLCLHVTDWAAIVSANTVEQLGAAEPVSAIPPQRARRLPLFSLHVLRCALPLLRNEPRRPVVFSSPNGDLDSTVTLLSGTSRQELLSPTLFALSVHNAPAGALSLCLDAPGDQISLAGGAASLSAGLTEAYVKLATQEASSIVLVHADDRLPPVYADLDDEPRQPGVFLAMSLRLPEALTDGEIRIAPGRAGAARVVGALNAGQRRLLFSPPNASEAPA